MIGQDIALFGIDSNYPGGCKSRVIGSILSQGTSQINTWVDPNPISLYFYQLNYPFDWYNAFFINNTWITVMDSKLIHSSKDLINWPTISSNWNGMYILRRAGCTHSVNGKQYMYLISGWDSMSLNFPNCWSKSVHRSSDGITWNKISDIPSNGRRDHQVVSLNGKIYIIGGLTQTNGVWKALSDVLVSIDGFNWTVSLAPFAGTYNHSCVAHMGNKIIMTSIDGVWMFDGTTWTQKATSTPFPPPNPFSPCPGTSALISVGETLFHIGGTYYGSASKDIYKSTNDGATWTYVAGLGNWQGQTFPMTVLKAVPCTLPQIPFYI